MKFGRVVTAKIYTNKKQPHGNCLGHVTMFDADMATLCMQKMHRATFKGQMVIVEKVRGGRRQWVEIGLRADLR